MMKHAHGQVGWRMQLGVTAGTALWRDARGAVKQGAGLFVLHKAGASCEHFLHVIFSGSCRRDIEILGEVQRRGSHRRNHKRGGKGEVGLFSTTAIKLYEPQTRADAYQTHNDCSPFEMSSPDYTQ